MKKIRVVAIIITLIGGGAVVHNYTGIDIILPNGETIKTRSLDEHLTKEYKDRSLDVPMEIYLHHTVTKTDASIESINQIHLNNNWPRLSYHIAIDEDGDIYFINDLDKHTYHTGGKNTRGISIVLIGNFEKHKPSEDMIDSTREIIDILCNKSFLNIVGIKGHKDVKATLCPGKYAYDEFKDVMF